MDHKTKSSFNSSNIPCDNIDREKKKINKRKKLFRIKSLKVKFSKYQKQSPRDVQ